MRENKQQTSKQRKGELSQEEKSRQGNFLKTWRHISTAACTMRTKPPWDTLGRGWGKKKIKILGEYNLLMSH